MSASGPAPRAQPGVSLRAVEPELFVNRELSFLEFHQRIVQEAADPSVPLLERLKFIAIVSANLDEFFMVRVAGLKQQLKSGVLDTGPDKLLAKDALAAVLGRVTAQVREQERVLLDEVLPSLRNHGIGLYRVDEISPEAREQLFRRFEQQVFPMLTPLAVDPGHPFPFLKNRIINLAIHLVPERSVEEMSPLLAVVQVPPLLPRFITVDMPGDLAVVLIEDLITACAARLFPGMRIIECVPFRVIRNWDLSFDEEEQEDLLETVQKELRKRWRLDAVRLEIGAAASSDLADKLRGALDLSAADVARHLGPVATVDLARLLPMVGRPDLRDELFVPVRSPDLREGEDLFASIARGDVLLHHPYESYEPVIELLERAAVDPQVLAIKQTLYRVNRDSPILRSLILAAENGKQVTALVELKARFDEELNVEWARLLEEAGVHVVYGMIGLKTHCKVTLLVRREPNGVRRYVHLGTGNYNEQTATVYSDLSIFSARTEVADDISALFNLLTGYSEPPVWKKLAVAPVGLRRRILDAIDTTREGAKRGEKAKIVVKSNALIDPRIIRALCKASQQGVETTLLIRGPCTLRVGIPGLSDKLVVRTVIDRFLEHSRIFYFQRGSAEEVFVTSSDVMPRNFDRRVDVMLPIEEERLKRRIVDEILGLELQDNTKAAILEPDGTYTRIFPKEGQKPLRAQAELIALAKKRGRPDAAGVERRKKDKKKGR